MDIQGFYDNILDKWLIRMLRYHEAAEWIVLYVKRFIAVPTAELDGSLTERNGKGIPQGGVISPLLANMMLHHVFDKWFRKYFQDCAFERYADDIVIHCHSRQEAQEILQSLEKRLAKFELSLHPKKRKIVSTRNNGKDQKGVSRSFTFVGFTFKPQKARTKKGRYFTGFRQHVSRKAEVKIWDKLSNTGVWSRTNKEIEHIAEQVNPHLRGWLEYYRCFSVWDVAKVAHRINSRICKWLRKRYKIRSNRKRGWEMLKRIHAQQPNLFAHWQIGYKP